MHEHYEVLEARYVNLADENVKRLINRPAAVRRRSERDPKAPSVKGETSAVSGGLKAKLARLQEEPDKANKRLSQGEGKTTRWPTLIRTLYACCPKAYSARNGCESRGADQE